jgi:hypothetical protein
VRTLGIITTVLAAIVAVLAVAVAVRSIPDIRRYLKIRSM